MRERRREPGQVRVERRAGPFRQGGGRMFSKADRSRFLDVLDRVLRQTARGGSRSEARPTGPVRVVQGEPHVAVGVAGDWAARKRRGEPGQVRVERRADPFRQGGGRMFSEADRSRFLDVLDRVLRQAVRGA